MGPLTCALHLYSIVFWAIFTLKVILFSLCKGKGLGGGRGGGGEGAGGGGG